MSNNNDMKTEAIISGNEEIRKDNYMYALMLQSFLGPVKIFDKINQI